MWARKWLMTFNVDKCEVVQISLKPQSETSYILYNSKLKQVIDAKYLGVIIDSKLSFNKHIDMTCKKANSTLSFLRRNLYHCQRNVKIDAYHTYVRLILEYAVTAWAPTLREILIKSKPFNVKQQDLSCQIFNLQQCHYHVISIEVDHITS